MILGFLAGGILGEIWAKITHRVHHFAVVKGFHFHHSLFFVPLVLIAVWIWGSASFLIGSAGFGVLAQHTFREGFVFVTKD